MLILIGICLHLHTLHSFVTQLFLIVVVSALWIKSSVSAEAERLHSIY